MRHEEQPQAMHLLQQPGSFTRDSAQSLNCPAQFGDYSQSGHPPSTPTREAAIRAAQVIAYVHAAAAAAAATRDKQVADFVFKAGAETHATAIAARATEEEAAMSV